jgi:hypothetical protein
MPAKRSVVRHTYSFCSTPEGPGRCRYNRDLYRSCPMACTYAAAILEDFWHHHRMCYQYYLVVILGFCVELSVRLATDIIGPGAEFTRWI